MNPKKLQLLIIDDSFADTRLLRALLEQALPDGFDLRHEMTAEAGIRLINEHEFDCLLLDYLLENDSGLEVLRSLRASGHDLPVIAISGNGSEDVAVQALKLGAQDYMVKGSLTSAGIRRALLNSIDKVALTRQLAERRQELEDFAHVAAHDLCAPLASISLFVEWLRDKFIEQSDSQTREVFERIMVGTDSMSRLLDNLLEYAEVGRSQKELHPLDLSEVAKTTYSNLRKTIHDAEATVEISPLPHVLGDQVALVQLLQNLIANAIKFRTERKPVVKVSARSENDRWLISVTDNGIGVDPDHFQEIFAPFRRLHGQSKFEGSGIGLATCKRIVDQHGGEIWVESKLGQGTTFKFTLSPLPKEATDKMNSVVSVAAQSSCLQTITAL